jgi:hypothetical protein
MATALSDLRLLSEELHVTELQHDRAVQFLMRALEALIQRRDALIFHKPPAGVMLRGATSFGGAQRDGLSQENGAATSARTSGEDGAAGSVSEQSGSSSAVLIGSAFAKVCRVLTSNPYASFDACGDLDGFRCPGVVSSWLGGQSMSQSAEREAPETASLNTSCVLRGDALTSGLLFASANVPSPQHMPYVGRVIAVHNGHNGWPEQTALDSLTDFLVQASLA